MLPVPHYHVLLRSGSAVWTYAHPERAPRQIRLLTEGLFKRGHRPLILRCDRPVCRVYPPGFTEHSLPDRINRLRSTDDSYVQIRPAPTP